VVFLMLIFFLIAGTLVANRDRDLMLALTGQAPAGSSYSDALIVRRDGTLVWRGRPVELSGLPDVFGGAWPKSLKLAPDRRAKAADLVRVAAQLRQGGVGTITLVTRRGGEGS